jgi:predicted neuraminidase|nr:sialidase family protein [uncultured Lachnoclostridium sp.]
MKTIAHELIIPKDLINRNCHASHCLPLSDGSVFAVWFEGTKEGNDDVCIWGAKRSVDGTWSQKKQLTEDNHLPHWNPVLLQSTKDTITLYYKQGKPISNWYTMYMTSIDNGNSWSKPKELVPGDIGGRGPVRNKAIVLSNGWILAPSSSESSIWSMFSDLSKDNGITWTTSNKVNIFHDSEVPLTWYDKLLDNSLIRKKRGVIQPTFWESTPGHVHALLRSSEGKIYYAESLNYGQSWNRPQKTILPNNNSGIDAVKTPNGHLYLIYNPVDKNWGKRYPISLAISKDNGSTWNKIMDLESGSGKDELSYPCIQFQDNRLYITYTHNRTNISFWILTI